MGVQSLPSRSAWSHARFALTALLALAVLCWAAASAVAAEPKTVTDAAGNERVVGQVIVKFESGAGQAQKSSSLNAVDSEGTDAVGEIEGARLVDLGPGVSVNEAVAELESRGAVEYAEPNYVIDFRATPNDPFYPAWQWGVYNYGQQYVKPGIPGYPLDYGVADKDTDTNEAWDITTGSSSVKVAVVDSGIEAGHPDLDGNIDSANAWTFATNYPNNWAIDRNGHGTHVAGIIGAEGNNGTGLAGVNWDVGIVPVQVGEFGTTTANFAAGLDYAGSVAKVANVSIGGPSNYQIVQDGIIDNPQTLYVVAAGNGEFYGPDGAGDDNDLYGDYPCTYPEPNIVCVANYTPKGNKAYESNFGDYTVDLGAPGNWVRSTYTRFTGSREGAPDNTPYNGTEYEWLSGTSMSAPYVTGAAALALSVNKHLTTSELKKRILDNVDPMASLSGDKTLTGGGLNTYETVRASVPYNTQCTAPDGSVYRTVWDENDNATFDIQNLEKKGPGQPSFSNFVDYWADVAKLEWWSPDTLSHVFTQSGAWGDYFYTDPANAWSYAASYGAVDQRTDVLATSPFGFLSPRVSFRTNGDGLARSADVCNNFLGKWSTNAGKRTFVAGDSMVTQMAKKLLNQTGWKVKVEPQSKSSFANMRGEIRGMAAGLIDPTTYEQTKPETIVLPLGTRDADAIGAQPTAAARTSALNTFKSNVDGVLADTSAVQCRVLVTVHQTGWKADGSYSAEQLQARKDVNAKLRAVANASSSVDLVDWQAISAGHEAHQPSGRYYEPSDRDNPNGAGLTALSNAIINEAQGSCS